MNRTHLTLCNADATSGRERIACLPLSRTSITRMCLQRLETKVSEFFVSERRALAPGQEVYEKRD